MSEFARTGYFGTSTETIARLAGISHAYLFRLFGTKKDLFLACAERTCERTLATFRAAAERWHAEPRAADRARRHGHGLPRACSRTASCSSSRCSSGRRARIPTSATVARAHYGEVIEEVERLSGADPDALRAFFARGMLLNVAAAMSLDDLAGREEWVSRLLPHLETPEGAVTP